jgi:hypothetical protein
MTESSIYFCPIEETFDAIDRLDLASEHVARVGKLATRIAIDSGQFSVSD